MTQSAMTRQRWARHLRREFECAGRYERVPSVRGVPRGQVVAILEGRPSSFRARAIIAADLGMSVRDLFPSDAYTGSVGAEATFAHAWRLTE